MARFVLVLAVLLATGCTHHQLRYDTINQADTLNDIYRRQVLDNLAMFVVDPHSIPHFAIPNGGTSTVSDTGSLAFSPLNAFRKVAGLTGSRNVQESWALSPVRDPDKLRRMRCAYQQAVGACEDCIDCCALQKRFLGKSATQQIHVRDPITKAPVLKNGDPILDPLTREPFVDVDGEPFIDPRTNEPYQIDCETGCVTIPEYDCDGPCAIKCGWFRKGTCWSVPASCRDYAGSYHSTYVWVEPAQRNELAKLILAIIDYAEKDPPPSRTMKDVTLLVDRNGRIAKTPLDVRGIVKATIAVGDENKRILRVDRSICEKETEKVQRKIDSIKAELNSQLKVNPSTAEETAAQSRVLSSLRAALQAAEEEKQLLESEERLEDIPPPSTGGPTRRSESSTGAGALYERMLLDALAPPTRP